MNLKKKTIALYKGFFWPYLFTYIRFWTGSIEQIEEHIPKKGKVLDLGCGYGIVANYVALCSKYREVVGVETDTRKIKFANRGIKNTTFFRGDATKAHLKNLDAVLILDVLHHLYSYQAGEQLVKDCRGMLKKNGKLIIFEVDNHTWWKWCMGRVIDFVFYLRSPRIYYRYRADMVTLLKKYFPGKNIQVITPDAGPFSQLLYVCKKE